MTNLGPLNDEWRKGLKSGIEPHRLADQSPEHLPRAFIQTGRQHKVTLLKKAAAIGGRLRNS